MFIPTERARYLLNDLAPFGKAVYAVFPEVAGDVLDASRSIGAGLPTGAVFYLMRVMECGIRRLAKRLALLNPLGG